MLATYTIGKSSTRTDEETSTDGTTDGNHVKMACLHGLVEDNQWATLGAALEGLHVETIAGHEVLLFTPFSRVLLLGGDGGLGNTLGRLLVDGSDLFVVHVGRSAKEGRAE